MLRRALVAALAGLPVALSHAQDRPGEWPTRPIRLVVPFPPVGSPDLIARQLGQRLGHSLGRPVVVEDRPGAGGTIGADIVAKAAADGYTLGVSNVACHAVAASVYPSLPYDPLRNFTHIALLAELPLTLAVSADGPIRSLSDLAALAHTLPGGVRIGTPGNGTTAYVSLEALRRQAGIAVEHVRFRGGGMQAALETIAGRIECVMASLGEISGNDRLRLLATAAEARVPSKPDLKTFREQGIDLVATVWFGLCAPAGLPAPIADRLHAEATAFVIEPDVAAFIAGLGAVPPRVPGRAAWTDFIAAEGVRWGELAFASGAHVE